jgi:hypothetical protein
MDEIVEKLERIQMNKLDGNSASAESPGVYKPPRGVETSQTQINNLGLSVTRTPSLIVNMPSLVSGIQLIVRCLCSQQSKDYYPIFGRRNSSCSNFFSALSHKNEHYQSNWRARTRAISGFFQRGKGRDTASLAQIDTPEARTGQLKRTRILSLIPRPTVWN